MRNKFPTPKKRNGRVYCPECGKDFADMSGYRYHFKAVHGEPTKGAGKVEKLDVEACKEMVGMILSDLPSRDRIKPPVVRKGDLKPESWVLLFSDLHYGQLVKGVEVGGLSEYSPLIARERIELLQEKIIRFLAYHPNKPNELIIAFLGDIVDGSVLRGNQQSNIAFGVVKQAIGVTELLVDFIVNLSKYFPKIRCYGVYGNHARLTPNPKDAHPAENFDMLIYHNIWDRIKNMKDITMEYTEAQHMIVRIANHLFWMEHGDTVRSWMGIPFYGSQRERAHIQEIMGMFKERADYVLLGHHHNDARFSGVHLNGSFVGGDLFSIGRLRRMSLPVQNLLGVNDKHGVVWERPIRLFEKHNIKPKIYR